MTSAQIVVWLTGALTAGCLGAAACMAWRRR